MATEELSGHKIKSTGQFQKDEAPPLIRTDRRMRWVSLHHHSTFSFLDGFGLPESHVRRAAELGMPAIALTEHGNVSSHVPLEKAAKKYGVQPIFGCELYAGDVDPERRSARKNHLTVVARSEEGYRNLLRIVSRSYEDFYYEPTVAGHVLAEHKSGLFVLSGCQGSLLATSLVGGKNISENDASYSRAKKVAQRMKRAFGDSFFLEVQMFPELEKARQINQAYERMGRELGIPLVATGDIHYTSPDENEMQIILHNVRSGGKQSFEEQARSWGYDVPLSIPFDDKYVYDRLRASGLSHRAAQEAIDNAALIGQDAGIELPKLERVRFPLPEGFASTEDVWRSWINEGWRYREIDKKENWKEYRDRLKYEANIIERKGFVDYFLVVSDLVKFAKKKGIPVGPARGSAAASLICYLLRITEVNPMDWPSLVFERFIDLTREDLPDIDLDFDDQRRDEIKEYAVSKYGADCVANIGTFTTYKSKNSLDDVARAFRIPSWAVEELKGYMIERSSGDLRASSTIEDTAEMFPQAAKVFEDFPDLRHAMQLEGNYRGMSIHAGGLVISSEPITNACAIYTREDKATGTHRQVVSVDKYDAEYLGILKLDVLGLRTMGFFATALEWLGMSLDDLYKIPLDDDKVIQGFRENDTVGIFQFDGRATRSVCAEVRPDSIFEIADINALSRPGPLHGGATAEYIEVKRGRKEPRQVHPVFDEICKHTYGTIVYQEQILRIVREIGNFDWTHASYIRRIISKKMGEQEFNRQWESFKNGALANDMDEETARKIWNECITAGAYAFNAAHSVSYGLIAYWSMWMKVYHPAVFYAAALARLDADKKQLSLLRDAVKHGIKVEPPTIHSGVTWMPGGDDTVVAGLIQIPGIGERSVSQILEARDELKILNRWEDIPKLKGWGPKKLENILTFVNKEDPFEIFALERKINRIRRAINSGKWGYRIPRPTHKTEDIPYSRGVDVEVVWVGVITHRNLRDIFELHFSRTGTELDRGTVRDPDLNEYVVMFGTDETDVVAITVDRWKYPRFKEAIWGLELDEDVVLVRGKKKGNQARRAIYVNELWVFGE